MVEMEAVPKRTISNEKRARDVRFVLRTSQSLRSRHLACSSYESELGRRKRIKPVKLSLVLVVKDIGTGK